MIPMFNEITIAAKWWADKLRGPVKFDNGDVAPASQIASGLAAMLRDSIGTPPDEAIEIFRSEVERLLVEDPNVRDGHGRLSVDYHPCAMLHDAATSAGIEVDGLLPWKTTMLDQAGVGPSGGRLRRSVRDDL